VQEGLVISRKETERVEEMKKMIVAAGLVLTAGLVALAADNIRVGQGRSVSVLVSGTNLSFVAGARYVTVINQDTTDVVYVSINSSVVTLTNDVANGAAFRIPKESQYTFGITGAPEFTSVQLATDNASKTNTVVVNAY
jgi:hypothetical protein